jgi:hypothetical protein
MKALIIGGGPSYWKKLHLAKSFDGIIISTDIAAPHIIDEGITPHYIVTLEKNEGIEVTFFPDSFEGESFEVIHQKDALSILTQRLEKLKLKHRGFRSYRQEYISNVGLYSCRFAREILNIDELYLIGFDHSGINDLGQVVTSDAAKRWIADFGIFLNDEIEKCKVINCSGQGKLYLEGITDGTALESI